MDDEDASVRRFDARGDGGWHSHVKRVVAGDGGERLLRTMHARLREVLADRPEAVVVPSVEGDEDATYAALLAALAAARGWDTEEER
jgi:hypothetical protein